MKKLVSVAVLCSFAYANGVYAEGLAPESFNRMYSLAQSGDVYALRNAAERGLNIDSMNSRGYTGLCVAIARRDQRAYNTFRAAGANPRHPCTQTIPADQYESFMASSGTIGATETPRAAYNVINNHTVWSPSAYHTIHTGWFWSPKFWTIAGLAAAGGAALALKGGGGGKKHHNSNVTPVYGDVLALKAGSYVQTTTSEGGSTTPVSYTTRVLTPAAVSSDYYEITSLGSFVADDGSTQTLMENEYEATLFPLDKAEKLRVATKVMDGLTVVLMDKSSIAESSAVGLAVSGWKENQSAYGSTAYSSFIAREDISVSAKNAAFGIVASNLASATNFAYNAITVTNTGGGNWRQGVVGMYADSGASIINNRAINVIGGDSGEGYATAMMVGQTTSKLKSIPSDYLSSVITKAINNSKITLTSSGLNSGLVGIGSYLSQDVIKYVGLMPDITLDNNGTIDMTYGSSTSGSAPGNLLDNFGLRGGIGMRADSQTTATNNGLIQITGGTDQATVMLATNGGTIINEYNPDIDKGLMAVGGKYAKVDTTFSLDLTSANGLVYGMTSLKGLWVPSAVNNIIHNGEMSLVSDGSSAIYIDTNTNIDMGANSVITMYGSKQSLIANGDVNVAFGDVTGGNNGVINLGGTISASRAIANYKEATFKATASDEDRPHIHVYNKNSSILEGLFANVYNTATINLGDGSTRMALYDNKFKGVFYNSGTINHDGALYDGATYGSSAPNYVYNIANFVNESGGVLNFTSNTYKTVTYDDESTYLVKYEEDEGGKVTEYNTNIDIPNIFYGENFGNYTLGGTIVASDSGVVATLVNGNSFINAANITSDNMVFLIVNVPRVYNIGTINASGNTAFSLTNSPLYNTGTINGGIKGASSSVINYGEINIASNNDTISVDTIYNNGTINVSGNNITQAIAAKSMVANNSSGIINVSGDYSYGMYVNTSNQARNDGEINVSGSQSHGINISQTNSKATNFNIINVSGNNSTGMYAHTSASAINNGTINVSGNNSYGMYAAMSATAYNYGTINISGSSTGSYGMYAVAYGTVYNYGTINVYGNGNIGMLGGPGSSSPGTNFSEIHKVSGTTSQCYAGGITNEGTCEEDLTPMMMSAPKLTVLNTKNLNLTSTAIKVDENSSFINSGIISTDEDLNVDDWKNGENATVEATSDSVFKANSISGTIVANSEIVQSDTNERTYETTDNFVGNTDNLTLTSGSYLFKASLKKSLGAPLLAGSLLQMKDFNEVMADRSLGDWLNTNYDNGNRVQMFNRLKAPNNQAAYEEVVNEELGLNFVPTLAKQNIDFMRNTNMQMADTVFENINNGSGKFVGGVDYYHHRNSSHDAVMGYDTDGTNIYGVYNEDKDGALNTGFGFSISTIYSDYKDNSSVKQTIAQGYMPIAFTTDDFDFVTMPKFGAGYGEYKRKVTGDDTHHANIPTYYYGLSNQLRKAFNVGEFEVEPVAEFNVLSMYMGKTKEHDNMYVKSQNSVSTEGGLGLYIGKTIEFNNGSELTIRVGGTYYHEYSNPYQTTSAGFVDADGFYHIKGYKASKDRGVLALKADYSFALFDMYLKAMEYIEDNSNFSLSAGMKYKF